MLPVPNKSRPVGSSLRADEFQWISDFLRQKVGISLKSGKQVIVVARLERRLRALKLPHYSDYFAYLMQPNAEGDAEATLAIDLLTTNETYFFRENQHFDFVPDVTRTDQGYSKFKKS